MSSKNHHPKWWQLYLSFLLLAVAFLVENRLNISTRGHQAAQLGIILVLYGYVLVWIKTNLAVMSYRDREQYASTFKLVLPSSSGLAETGAEKLPMLDLPDSEIKGLLGDTFDIGFVVEEPLPIKEDVKEERNKECTRVHKWLGKPPGMIEE